MIHDILNFYFSFKRRSFIKDSYSLEAVQKKKLENIFNVLRNTSHYQSLHKPEELLQGPLRTYTDFEPLVERQIQTHEDIISTEISRYEYTSGSTKSKKKIPYSKEFLNELNEASSVWMGDLYQKYPGIKGGPHYWTLSWNPDQDTDDSNLFPWLQRIFLQKILLLNHKIKSTPTLESSWFATLVYLIACRNLSLISIWSPTLLMRIKRDIQSLSTELYKTLMDKHWAMHTLDLSGLPIPAFDQQIDHNDLASFNVKKIWPKLSLVSAWDSANSRFYFDELRSQMPDLNFQGKGLWATEAVVSIPFDGKKVLAYKSHYYEFRCLDSGKIYQSWELKKDQIIEPIITSANGFTRYLIEDQIQVSDFYNSVPCFDFLGRSGTSDMVGEKLTDSDFQKLQVKLPQKFPVKSVYFFAVNDKIPFYQAVCEMSEGVMYNKAVIQIFLENLLLANYNYKIARELHQLQEIHLDFTEQISTCLDVIDATYAVRGQFKVLSLYRINKQTHSSLSAYFLK